MATVRDVVTRAHRIVGVVDRETPIEPHEASIGVQSLNDMIKGWETRGVDVNHDTDYTLSSTFETATLTAAYRDHVTYLLADAIAPEYGKALTPSAAMKADKAWRVISAKFVTVAAQTIDKGLRAMPSQYWGFNRHRSR